MSRREVGKHSIFTSWFHPRTNEKHSSGYDRIYGVENSDCCGGKNLFLTPDGEQYRCNECDQLWPLDCPQIQKYNKTHTEPVRNLIGGTPFKEPERKKQAGHTRTFGRKK